jgi:hypothetical protein
MLDRHFATAPTVAEIERLPCFVELPAALEAAFESQGPTASLPGCKRRFPRFRCRGKNKRVALEYRQSLPGLPRGQVWFAAYITDISRGGVGLLHSEPLYPKERFRIVLLDGSLRQIEIVRCQRLDEYCYALGACFVGEELPIDPDKATDQPESHRPAGGSDIRPDHKPG